MRKLFNLLSVILGLASASADITVTKTVLPIDPALPLEPAQRILYHPVGDFYSLYLRRLVVDGIPLGVTWSDTAAPAVTELSTPELVQQFAAPVPGAREIQTLFLSSGTTVGVGFNIFDNAGDIDLQLLVSSRKPGGEWIDQVFTVCKLPNTLYLSTTLTQGPDGLLYWLACQDGSWTSPLIRLRETANGLELVDVDCLYLPSNIGDPLARHGELPPLALGRDDFRAQVIASYPNNYGPDPNAPPLGISNTRGSLISIQPDLTKSLEYVFPLPIWQYYPPVMGFCFPNSYGVAGYVFQPDYSRAWILQQVSLDGALLQEQSVVMNHNSAWNERGWAFANADGQWVLYRFSEFVPEPPKPPKTALTGTLNKTRFRLNRDTLTVSFVATPGATISGAVNFPAGPKTFTVSARVDGQAYFTTTIRRQVGPGAGTVTAMATASGFLPSEQLTLPFIIAK